METAQEVFDAIKQAMSALSPEEAMSLSTLLYQYLDEQTGGAAGSGEDGRLPRYGKNFGKDASKRSLAGDAKLAQQDRNRQSFLKRFPGAARIEVLG